MRARKARVASNGEHILVDERCILCVPRDVVAVDLVGIGHLGVEVARVAQTGRGVDVGDGDGCCVEQTMLVRVVQGEDSISGLFMLTIRPLIDGMRVSRSHIGVGVFPIEVHSVLEIDKHGICDRAFSPAVAANASVAVEVLPVLLITPLVVSIPPAILLECGIVRSVPQVHSYAIVSRVECLRLRQPQKTYHIQLMRLLSPSKGGQCARNRYRHTHYRTNKLACRPGQHQGP